MSSSVIRPAAKRDDQVAVLLGRDLPRVDVELGPHHGLVVDLAVVGEVRADQVEVGARPQPAPLDQRLLGHRRRAHDVGLLHRGREVVGHLGPEGRGQRGGAVAAAVPDQHPLDRRAHGAVRGDEVGRQPARADHEEDAAVGPGQEAGAERRVARRLPVGELGAVDERERGAVPAVEQDVERLHGRDGRVGREHGDELDAEHVAGAPRRQAEEGLVAAVGPEDGPAHDRRRLPVALLQPVHQVQVGQEPGDVGAVEHRQPAQVRVLAHDRSLADPAPAVAAVRPPTHGS